MKVVKSSILQVFGVAVCAFIASPAFAQSDNASDRAKNRLQELIEYWTPERRATAQPRDLVLDRRGLAYMKGRNGVLTPYGHTVAALNAEQPKKGKPSGGDSTPPEITNMSPNGDTLNESTTSLSADVRDDTSSSDTGVKSVSFEVAREGGLFSSYKPTSNGSTYSTTLTGFSDGDWVWRVIAKDNGPKGGNESVKEASFSVLLGGDPGDGGSGGGDTGDSGGSSCTSDSGGAVVNNERWTACGDVQNAAGRLLYEMPNIRGNRIRGWSAYVCSGTVVKDQNSGRSVILTAAHCVYDDVAKRFAKNVIFIPNQDQTEEGAGTDWDCSNDPLGCWAPEFGVVADDWAGLTFPDNIPWDYAYYVVLDPGGKNNKQLDDAVAPMPISFLNPGPTSRTYALGYSYSDDPYFMHCAENMNPTAQPDNWWLASCGLSGGSSGGPWVQSVDTDFDTDQDPIMSVNSWGYQGSPGMAGPKLTNHSNGDTASCLFQEAENNTPTNLSVGYAGITGCTTD